MQFLNRPSLYSDVTFREGFALLEKYELIFDAWCFSSQLSELYDLACAFPNTTIVLDHMATPLAGLGVHSGVTEYNGKQVEILEQWRKMYLPMKMPIPVNIKHRQL